MTYVHIGLVTFGLTPDGMPHAVHGGYAGVGADIGLEDAECAFSSVVPDLDLDRDRGADLAGGSHHGHDSHPDPGPDTLPPAERMTACWMNNRPSLASGAQPGGLKT
mmetsp:Transcript_8771/g.14939  ORF Transcript_8771/g.14939 Transcript_8771/m.14939 type:complete len:107 (-) Transcript_8771:1214-1534(-)